MTDYTTWLEAELASTLEGSPVKQLRGELDIANRKYASAREALALCVAALQGNVQIAAALEAAKRVGVK